MQQYDFSFSLWDTEDDNLSINTIVNEDDRIRNTVSREDRNSSVLDVVDKPIVNSLS